MGGHWYAGTSGPQLPCKVGCACSQHCCKLSRCEQAFSHMGLIQTATHSKLSIDKVHKTTIIRIDLKWSHIAGLVQTWEHQDFSMLETSGSGATGIGEDSEVTVEVEDLEIPDFCNAPVGVAVWLGQWWPWTLKRRFCPTVFSLTR